VAKWWRREEVERTILLMSDGSVLDEERLADCKDYLDAQGITVLKSRPAKSYKVKRHLMTGAGNPQDGGLGRQIHPDHAGVWR
jgi:hypothetical protein